MNRILLFLLCSLIFSGHNDFILKEYNSHDFYIEYNIDQDIHFNQKGEFTSIYSSKGYTGIIGMPKLPQYSTMIMLDPLKEYDISYEIKSSRIIHDIRITPNQHMINGLEKESIEDVNMEFYNSQNTYPYVSVLLSEPMIMRDIVTSNLIVVPFKYTPSKNQLEIYETIKIHVTQTGNREDIRKRDLPKSKVFEKIYQNEILNYSQSQRDDEYQPSSILYICSSSIESNGIFQQLVEWRRQRGYVVYTASLSETGSSASSIKNYIENAYENYSPAPEYISLIGDVGGDYSIPTYYEDFNHDSYGNACEGDHPYSQLDGSDLLPEVLMGRMSVRTTAELSTVVSKIINYEKATYLGSLGNYYDKAAMFGDPSSSGNSCAITKEAIAGLLENHGFGDVYLKTSGSSWSTSMKNELSAGVLFFNYRGYLGMSGFSTGDVDDASNGWKLPFATVLTCGTGSFAEESTCMAEKFFKAGTTTSPKGGVAAIGTATWNTHTIFNNIFDLGVYDGLLADQVETAGAALASGKLALLNTYPSNPYQWVSAFTQWNNLMGDPATHLWTDTPKTMVVDHLNEISYGTNYITITAQDVFGNPINDALVTLLPIFGTIPTSLYTNEEGTITFDIDSILNGIINITVTKNNYKPYVSTVDIVTSESVNIGQGLIINDSNDGIPAAGETFGLSIPLHNYGNSSASGITATLSSDSPLVSMSNNTVSYGTILSGQSAYGGSDFGLSIHPSAIQSEELDLYLTISDQENQWSSRVNLNIIGSYLVPVGAASLEPGQTSSININLNNQGILYATGVFAELDYFGDLLTINDGYGSWGDINSGSTQSSTNGFNITVSGDVVSGSQIIVSLNIYDDNGYDRSENYIIRIGSVSEDDPLGPDEYGYYIYDSGDTDYDLSPDYNWIEISSSGTNLNLSNSGNGNWSGNGPLETVNLPFTFQFYGVDYNQMTVCTNGWVALGETNAASFRNYPIPGAGGPSPMIAAFWDDLETGNNGDVYVYSSNDYVIVQWTDMRTNYANSLETFQMILYNDSNQPYGDNSIKIQYKEFNNTSSGNFSAYPPIHGSYATIGIENHLANDGLQYSYYNDYPTAAMNLSNNTSIYITSQSPITLPVPQLSLSDSSLEFEVDSESSSSSVFSISNNGEPGSYLTYEVSQSYPGTQSPFLEDGGGPDGYGYYWSDSDINSELDYEWVDITGAGTQVSFATNDDGTSLMDIGFDFTFYGETYSQFLINPNGWIGFGEDNDEWYNSNIPSSDFPRPAIFGFWDDLNPVNDDCSSTCSGNVYYQSTSDRLVVWYENVSHWSEDNYYDFQIVIYANNEIDINIRDIVGEYTATVGMQNASGSIATQVDQYNGNYFTDNTSFKFIKPFSNSWMSLLSNGGGFSGSLLDGDDFNFTVEIDTEGMPEGEYLAQIDIVTNAGDASIPVELTVLNELGLLGDLNGDTVLNISDIVLLVNIIVSDGDYSYNGDLNQDGLNNVMDIVQLVNEILNL